MPDETQNNPEEHSADVISEDALSPNQDDVVQVTEEESSVSVNIEFDEPSEDEADIDIEVVDIIDEPAEPEKDIVEATSESMDSLQARIDRALAETDDTVGSTPLSSDEQMVEDDIIDITETTTSSYPEPVEPEWKRVAREMKEERARKQREMLEAQKERSREVFERRKAEKEKMRKEREAYEAQNRPDWREKEAESEQAVQEKIEQLRQEREQKLDDFADSTEATTGRRFTYPKPEPRSINYPSPSELKRRGNEQPISQETAKEDEQPSPKPRPKSSDINSRISRLARPDTSDEPEPSSDDDSNDEES